MTCCCRTVLLIRLACVWFAPYPVAENSAIFDRTRTYADNADIRLSPRLDAYCASTVILVNSLFSYKDNHARQQF